MDCKPDRVLLVGTKCDRNLERAVSEEEGGTLANEANAHYFETSSKLDLNITELFRTAAIQMLHASVDDTDDIFAPEFPCCRCFDHAVGDPVDLLPAVSGEDTQGRYEEDDAYETYIGASDEVTESSECGECGDCGECSEFSEWLRAALRKHQQRTSAQLDELIEMVNAINESFEEVPL